jgi:hypothetical protein
MSEHKPGSYMSGRLAIIISIDAGAWHLSVSRADGLPSYNEMKQVRYQFLPDNIYMAEIFPPKDEFVNLHPFVRHLWQIDIDKSNYPQK